MAPRDETPRRRTTPMHLLRAVPGDVEGDPAVRPRGGDGGRPGDWRVQAAQERRYQGCQRPARLRTAGEAPVDVQEVPLQPRRRRRGGSRRDTRPARGREGVLRRAPAANVGAVLGSRDTVHARDWHGSARAAAASASAAGRVPAQGPGTFRAPRERRGDHDGGRVRGPRGGAQQRVGVPPQARG